ncbi:MAG: ABC transporter substrate-binding protein [Bacteroidota bacterium]
MVGKAVVFLVLAACAVSCGSRSEGEDRTVFRYNESKGITTLDPAFARNQTIIWPVSQIFNGLVELDDSLNVRPSIAKAWAISGDGLEYVFHLRTDVSFHPSPFFPDGTRKVRAADVEYSFRRITDPALASPGIWIFDLISRQLPFEVPDDSTLIIRLEKPFPPFLAMLSMPYCYIVPREVVEGKGSLFAREPVGTGPFMYKMWREDEKLVLVRNPSYFETDSVGHHLPYLDAVAITFIKDKQSEFLEFMKGNLDFLNAVHPSYKDELLTRSGRLNPKYEGRLLLLTQPYLNTEYLGFMLDTVHLPQQSRVLADRRVRQAINLGFDRERMMLYLRNNLGTPARGGFIPPGLKGALAPGEGYGYDPGRAARLLAEAGYPGGKGLPELELTTTSDYLDLCEYIQFELGSLGIRISISVATGGSFRNMVANSNLVFFRGSWIADYADAENYLALFTTANFSPEGPNTTHFSSGEYDRLYRLAAGITDDEKRAEVYSRMDRILVDEAPVVFLYYDMVVRFITPEISGFSSNPMNSLVLKKVKKKSGAKSS